MILADLGTIEFTLWNGNKVKKAIGCSDIPKHVSSHLQLNEKEYSRLVRCTAIKKCYDNWLQLVKSRLEPHGDTNG